MPVWIEFFIEVVGLYLHWVYLLHFRRYGRSLHARIEQWNHAFSFDSHDPSVYSSPTVTGLIEHYKDPSCCMFFEPLLTTPLHRNFPFDLQHLARSVISSCIQYDDINSLTLPRKLKTYCKEYHYKQRVKIHRHDDWQLCCSSGNPRNNPLCFSSKEKKDIEDGILGFIMWLSMEYHCNEWLWLLMFSERFGFLWEMYREKISRLLCQHG